MPNGERSREMYIYTIYKKLRLTRLSQDRENFSNMLLGNIAKHTKKWRDIHHHKLFQQYWIYRCTSCIYSCRESLCDEGFYMSLMQPTSPQKEKMERQNQN